MSFFLFDITYPLVQNQLWESQTSMSWCSMIGYLLNKCCPLKQVSKAFLLYSSIFVWDHIDSSLISTKWRFHCKIFFAFSVGKQDDILEPEWLTACIDTNPANKRPYTSQNTPAINLFLQTCPPLDKRFCLIWLLAPLGLPLEKQTKMRHTHNVTNSSEFSYSFSVGLLGYMYALDILPDGNIKYPISTADVNRLNWSKNWIICWDCPLYDTGCLIWEIYE